MALGNCNHLWLKRIVPVDELCQAIKALSPEATKGTVEVYRIGEWTLVAAEREPLVEELASSNLAAEWLFLDLEPDHDEWAWSRPPNDRASGSFSGDAEAANRLRDSLNERAALALSSLEHYVEWHYDLDSAVGTPGPKALEHWPKVLVEHVRLDLPAPPKPSAPPATAPSRPPVWPGLAGLGFVVVATGFLTLVTHAPADPWSTVFWFFWAAGGAFWTMLCPVLPRSWPGNGWLRWGLGLAALAAFGAGMGLVY
ncbi:MAG: hypothetical protein QM765_28445 [Myxococcales bacterium]